jgi:hypothetical protein
LISLIGIGTFKYVVESVSSKAAKEEAIKGVSEKLNEDYISKEIKEKSQKALENIISEAESRAKELVSLGYLFNYYINIGNFLAFRAKDRSKSLERYNEALLIWKQFSKSFPREANYLFLMNYSEIQSMNRKYDQALKSCSLAKDYASMPEQKILVLFYEIANLKLLNKDFSDQIAKFDNLISSLEEKAYLEWTFKAFTSFINDKENNFEEEDKKLIIDLTPIFALVLTVIAI